MEYTYNSVEQMQDDMARWQVQGSFGPPRIPYTIKSTVLPLEVLEDKKTEPLKPSGKPSLISIMNHEFVQGEGLNADLDLCYFDKGDNKICGKKAEAHD